MKNQRKSEKKLEVLMRTICDNFSFFFTPKNIVVIHLFVGQLSAWSFPRLVLLFQNLRSGEPTHRRLAHWKPFQEMMWWRYLLQLWLCLYFWLNSHWKPASSAIVFLYLLWFHVVCTTSLLRPGRVLYSAHKNNYYTDRLFCALSVALFCHEVCTSHKSFQTLLCLMAK